MSSSWLENIKNQHINLMEEEEEEEDQQEAKQINENVSKQEEEPKLNVEQEKAEEKGEETQEVTENKKEEKNETDKSTYNGPNTRETVLFSKSIDKLTSEEEKSYVETLFKIRGSLTSVLGQTSKTLKNGSLLNAASKKSHTSYDGLRKSILELPIPHVTAVGIH